MRRIISCYKYDASQFQTNGWMVHRYWGNWNWDEALIYGDYTAETAIQAAIERGSWA